MSDSDVPPYEMGWDPNAIDDALERMLSGRAEPTEDWRELAEFVEDLRGAAPARPLACEDLHVAAMVETSQLMADKGDPVARPVSNADASAPQTSRLPKRRRKGMKRSTRILVRVLAPIAAVFTVMGGMAYAGALPHTVQTTVSHAADTVGINLPGDDEGTDVPGDDQGENSDDQSTSDDQGDNADDQTAGGDQGDTADDQGDTADDQGDNSDDQGESSNDQTAGDDQGENADDQGDNDNQGEDTQGDSQGEDTASGDTQSSDQGDDQTDTQQNDAQQGDSQD